MYGPSSVVLLLRKSKEVRDLRSLAYLEIIVTPISHRLLLLKLIEVSGGLLANVLARLEAK